MTGCKGKLKLSTFREGGDLGGDVASSVEDAHSTLPVEAWQVDYNG